MSQNSDIENYDDSTRKVYFKNLSLNAYFEYHDNVHPLGCIMSDEELEEVKHSLKQTKYPGIFYRFPDESGVSLCRREENHESDSGTIGGEYSIC
jgi:hypothetical protein